MTTLPVNEVDTPPSISTCSSPLLPDPSLASPSPTARGGSEASPSRASSDSITPSWDMWITNAPTQSKSFVYSLTNSSAQSVKSIYSTHPSQLIYIPNISPGSSSQLITAANRLHLHPSIQNYYAEPPKSTSQCLCLSWHARKLGTKACNAAIMFCKQRYPNILEVGDSWVNAQQVLLGRIAAAQWAAYDAIRTKTGAVLDRVDHSNEQVPFDEYEEGHVQPWMTGKLVLAIRDAVFESLADIGKHTLKDLDASIYESFSFGGLGPVYDRPNRARFPCSCKAHEVNLIIEKEIDLAHHRINVGTIKLLKEDNAIENAENRARRHITNAAQDDMDVIIEENDEVQKCRPGDETHMEAWMRWHVQWKCDQAQREFSLTMRKHPQREHNDVTEQRHEEAMEAKELARIKRYGGEEKVKEMDQIDDERESTIMMSPPGPMPYPGCECLLWGATAIGNGVWNSAMRSFKGICPVASDWGDVVLDRILEMNLKAMKEIRDVVVAKKVEHDPKDHFPKWQQDILIAHILQSVDEAKELIRANNGAPGPVAKAAMRDAEKGKDKAGAMYEGGGFEG